MSFGKFFLKKGLKRHLKIQKIKIRIPLKNKNTSEKRLNMEGQAIKRKRKS
jgi:hypothetical protein